MCQSGATRIHFFYYKYILNAISFKEINICIFLSYVIDAMKFIIPGKEDGRKKCLNINLYVNSNLNTVIYQDIKMEEFSYKIVLSNLVEDISFLIYTHCT
jgi:hypothetical protein